MATLGYLEVLDPKGRVSQRFPVQSLPLTLGRAYTNHVIVDDPFVCPEHVTIGYDENGRLRVRDLIRFVVVRPHRAGADGVVAATACGQGGVDDLLVGLHAGAGLHLFGHVGLQRRLVGDEAYCLDILQQIRSSHSDTRVLA